MEPPIFAMAEKLEQCAAVKFCFVLGETAGKTVVMLETACKEAALGKNTSLRVVFPASVMVNCHLQTNLAQGDPRTFRTDKNIATIRKLILKERRRTTNELVDLCLGCAGVPANGF
jgi:hypothetical protein